MSGLAVALSLATGALVVGPGVGVGQDDVTRFAAAVAASPDDPRPRCELAFALVRAGRAEEAVAAATTAIDALRTRSDRASVRLLGACLYNRGRGHEALGHEATAIVDYADSLDLRPNETVAARLAVLEPDAPPGLPIALVAALVDGFSFERAAAVASARSRGGVRWSFVPSARLDSPTIVAVARVCGAPRAVPIAEAYFDNHGTLSVEGARAQQLGDLDAVVVSVTGAGDATCGEMDGVMDFEHRATAVVIADGCAIRHATFVTHADVCGQREPDGVAVRFDGAGNAIVTALPHHRPSRELGTFALRDLAR